MRIAYGDAADVDAMATALAKQHAMLAKTATKAVFLPPQRRWMGAQSLQ
jgi:hypothetical protein